MRRDAPAGIFCLIKRGPQMAGNRTPPDFHRQNGRIALDKCDHHHPQHVAIGALVLGQLRHPCRDRPHEAVAKQNAKKGSHQGRGDLVSDLFRRPAKRAHGNYHAEHGGDNAQPRQANRPWWKARSPAQWHRGAWFPCPLPSSGRDRTDRCPPEIAMRMVSHTKLRQMMVFHEGGILRKILLCSGSSISDSTAGSPSRRALLSISNIIFRVSR